MSEYLSWFGIAIGLGGILFSYLIYRRVGKIEKTRRDEQTENFKKLIVDNVEEVFQIYQSVSTPSHRTKLIDEELNEKTQELQRFFKINFKK